MRRIRVYGEGVLRERAEAIKNIDADTSRLIKNMTSTLEKSRGLGLAATQVGVLKRVFLALDRDGDRIITAVNPEFAGCCGEEIDAEGCLSFPEVYFSIQRARKIALKAYDEKGREFLIEAEGLLARCFQHEMDHLNGKLIIDYASDGEKKFWQDKLNNLTKSRIKKQ